MNTITIENMKAKLNNTSEKLMKHVKNMLIKAKNMIKKFFNEDILFLIGYGVLTEAALIASQIAVPGINVTVVTAIAISMMTPWFVTFGELIVTYAEQKLA